MTVRVFSGNAGKYVDRGVCPVGPGSVFVNGSACGNGKWRGGISLEEISAAFFLCLPENLISPVLPGLLIAGFIVSQPCGRRICDLKSPVFQTLINIYVCPVVYITGTGAALDRSDSSGAVQTERCSFFQRKEMLFIFQKNKSLRGGPAGQ